MRSAKMDNFRGLLMLLVVLGHLLELRRGTITDYLYLLIYSFHMPLFVWISGYFAKPADRSCARTLLLPYLVFQLLYSAQAVFLCQTEEELKLLEPYWLMWFLMALFLWRLLLPLLKAERLREQGIILALVLALSLLTGWEKELRYVLSFQRMVALFPMFLLGYYCRGRSGQISRWWRRSDPGERRLMAAVLVMTVLVTFALLWLFRDDVSRKWLYWKYPYGKRGGTVMSRATLLAFAVVCLCLFLLGVPDRQLPFLTRLGRNTLPVYLLHGFVIEFLDYHEILEKTEHPAVLISLLLAGMLLLFSSPPVGHLFRRCFGAGERGKAR